MDQLLCNILTELENRPETSIRTGRKIFNQDIFFVGKGKFDTTKQKDGKKGVDKS